MTIKFTATATIVNGKTAVSQRTGRKAEQKDREELAIMMKRKLGLV